MLTNPDLSNCPDNCFRPVGLAWDTKGRLWFSSDSTGEIFVLENDGSGNDDSGNDSGNDDSGNSDDSNSNDGEEDAAMSLLSGKSAALAVSFAAVVLGVLLA